MNCIITGASKGLGRAIAEKFAAGGYDIASDRARWAGVYRRYKGSFSNRYPRVQFGKAFLTWGTKSRSLSLGTGCW